MPAVNRRAPRDKSSHVQSVRFAKDDWTEARARAWTRDHDFITRGLDETENQYRFRQYDPEPRFFRYRPRTEDLPPGVTFLLGFPKRG